LAGWAGGAGRLDDHLVSLVGKEEDVVGRGIRNPIFASLGGFFSPTDGYRHAIVGTADGKVFEIFFNPATGTGRAYLACFEGILAADSFFSPDDGFSHVIVATPDGEIGETFYNQTGTFFSDALATFTDIVAVSGFYTDDDHYRHVIVATADGNLTEVFYHPSIGVHISEPPLARFNGIVDIAAFYTDDDKYRHVIVATTDGKITEVFYHPSIGVHISEPPLATFSGIVAIAGFYTSDDKYRHVIVATSDGNVTEVFYSSATGSHVSQPPLARFDNILGVAAFYTPDDGFRHALVALGNGSVIEVFYSSSAGSHISQPPLGVFAVDAPALDDISPGAANLDGNAAAVVTSNQVSTAGRSVSLAGSAGSLFVFNEKAGVWKNTGGASWTQLASSPLHADLFPPSSIAVDPADGNHIVAATGGGAFESRDGGAMWTPIAQTWGCGSSAIRAAAFAANSALLLATDCGIATRPAPNQAFSFYATASGVGSLSVAETAVWARAATELLVSKDNGTSWTPLLGGNATLQSLGPSSLAAFDDYVYMQTSVAGLGQCGAGNVLGVYNVATGTLATHPILRDGQQTCDGTGLGGHRRIRSFLRKDGALPDVVGPQGRRQLFFCAGQEVYQALGVDGSGNVTNWQLVLATTESGAATSSGGPPPLRIHADIWDFLIDTSIGGNTAWLAGDGGVYQIVLGTPFSFPESSGWARVIDGMHTHQAHMINVVPTNPVNRSRLAYPTADNEGWYRDTGMLVDPVPGWQVTVQGGNLGDANWSITDASAPRFALIVRNQELAAFINHHATPNIRFVSLLNFWKKKDANGNVQLAGGHFFPPGPTGMQFIPSPRRAGRFTTLDAVMMCDLPLIRYDAASDTNIPMLPGTPLGQDTGGQPVLLRNQTFDTSPDINASNAAGWSIEVPSFPNGAQGFYVTGSRSAPVYYTFTATALLRLDAGTWTTVATGVVAGAGFGPAFLNPFDSRVLYVITAGGIQVSNDGGHSFQPEPQLTALVAGGRNLPMSSLVQVAFNYSNPAEVVAGALSGVFYRNPAGRWANLTGLLPEPLSEITGVGIDNEAVYVSFDSRSIARVTGYRNAP
jgi:hypothetical protein